MKFSSRWEPTRFAELTCVSFVLQLALLAGARTVIVSDPSAPRRELATEFGAHLTVDPTTENLAAIVSDMTGGLGMDSIILCIGVPSLVNNAFHLARQSGRINLFAGVCFCHTNKKIIRPI